MYRPSPNLVQRVHTTQRIAAVVETLGEEGIAPSRALAGTGLKTADLKAPDTRVSYKQVETAFRNAIRLSNDPAIALRAGRRMHVMAYGMYGYALLSSPTLAQGIDFTAKYGRALGMVADVVFSRTETAAIFTLESLLSRNPRDDVYRFALEFAFATCQTLSKDIYGRSFKFSGLLASYPAPPHAKLYRRIFECPIQFDQRCNELQFDVSWIDRPVAGVHPTAQVLAGELSEQFFEEANQDGGIAADIRRILVERPGRFPNIETMAAELSLHPRALRRRLEAEGTSYRDLLADVRMKLAIEYLRTTQMTNDEIAARLDYSDAANFRHAFSRWTGKSPSDYRGG